ncbi:hypothetical protein KIH74_20295 [Kineosporia sp. J2-2]|uniref:Uncharacterized protein n=1 Tax=Kineosporia corallincola TaxID=2835133 RepID=A0ABS5TJK5_9ACTN|nr:hypothetical protein [Kineosporia corallincola]MBT0771289.1 hypothetical protein [Kineosporia corallincola]
MGLLSDIFWVGVSGLPLTVVLAVCGGVLRLALKRLPDWYFPAAMVLIAAVVAYAFLYLYRLDGDGGLETILPLLYLFNAVVAVVIIGVWWAVLAVRRRRRVLAVS